MPYGPYAALDVVEVVGSTNAELVAAARSGAEDRTVLIAEHQTAGRGRGGRSWRTVARSGLALSVLLRPARIPATRWSWLPLLAGVALRAVIADLGQVEAVLKWPNDLLLGSRRAKAAGILAEVSGGGVVLGIGLNVSERAEELPVREATSLAVENAACTERETLVTALLRRLDEEARRWSLYGGDATASGLHDAYRAHCATLGQQVWVELSGGGSLLGTALEIDSEGRLVLDARGVRQAVSAGDVTHLRVAG
ncbi:MAG: biotin--[acetyl-CoA-carboxylase] ligase [Actinomycetota bacterium]|nr:biotin--[acetyl-CoA-carboxylase] ligase [Actinomycetota bacterium]